MEADKVERRTYLIYASYILLVTGVSVLIGWLTDISLFRSIHPRLVPMNPLTAMGFILIGIWLIIKLTPPKTPLLNRFLIMFIPVILLMIGGEKIANMFFGTTTYTSLVPGWHISGKMSPAAAANFLALGLTMLVGESRLPYRNQVIIIPLLVVFIVSFIALFGYSIGNNDILAMRPFPPTALHTSFCFLAATVIFLFLYPANFFLRPFLSARLGGYSSRRLALYVLLVPFTMGFLRFYGEKAGLYNTGFGVSIQAVVSTLVLMLLIWYQAIILNQNDEKREAAEKRIEEYSREMEQFAFIASHDLKEPLRKISTFANMVQKSGRLEERDQVHIDKIVATSKRMQTLITDLLDFTKLVHYEEKIELIDVNAVISNILGDYEIVMLEKNATVVTNELPELEGVRFQINQLFYNLIGNSIKFCKPDVAPLINITCSRMSEAEKKLYPAFAADKVYYHFRLTDNGIGFDQAEASKIFGMFERLLGKTAYPGSGIGLSICKKIASNHEGEIFAESEPGKGSTFHVLLPAKQHIG